MTYVGKHMFLFSDICFLEMLMVSVALKDREGPSTYFYQADLEKPNKLLDKAGKYVCLPIQHNVLLLGLHYLASAQIIYIHNSVSKCRRTHPAFGIGKGLDIPPGHYTAWDPPLGHLHGSKETQPTCCNSEGTYPLAPHTIPEKKELHPNAKEQMRCNSDATRWRGLDGRHNGHPSGGVDVKHSGHHLITGESPTGRDVL